MRRFLPVLLLITLLLAGCRRNEFRVEFRLSPDVSDSYTLLYYASDPSRGMLLDRVAVINHGKGEVKCPTRYPSLVYMFKGGGVPALVFYAGRGQDIIVEGQGSSPLNWRVGGNKINEALTAWRLKNLGPLETRDRVKINEAVSKAVKAAPSDPVSTLLLLIYYDRGQDPKGFDTLYKSLSGDALDPEWTDLVSRSDMLGGYAPAPVKTGPLVFRTAGNGCDTIRFDSVPALLFFADNNYTGRDQDVRPLKEALRERTDSGRPQFVDVNMEPDSSAWRYQVRRDSLKGAVRAWMPLAFSDTAAHALGVNRIPLFVVVAKGGAIRYRGSSASDALRELKKLK